MNQISKRNYPVYIWIILLAVSLLGPLQLSGQTATLDSLRNNLESKKAVLLMLDKSYENLELKIETRRKSIFDLKLIDEKNPGFLNSYKLSGQLRAAKKLSDEADTISKQISELEVSVKQNMEVLSRELGSFIMEETQKMHTRTLPKSELAQRVLELEQLRVEKEGYDLRSIFQQGPKYDSENIRLDPLDDAQKRKYKFLLLNDEQARITAEILQKRKRINTLKETMGTYSESLQLYDEFIKSSDVDNELFENRRGLELLNKINQIQAEINQEYMNLNNLQIKQKKLISKIEQFETFDSKLKTE